LRQESKTSETGYTAECFRRVTAARRAHPITRCAAIFAAPLIRFSVARHGGIDACVEESKEGRRNGSKPPSTKRSKATVNEALDVSTSGIKFEVWTKWKKKDKKLGTLTVSVGGLRWRPDSGKKNRRRSWDDVNTWFDSSS
jgi:hypothetical protein